MVDLSKSFVIDTLVNLHSANLLAIPNQLNDFCKTKSEEALLKLCLTLNELHSFLSSQTNFDIPSETFQEKYLSISIYLLQLLSNKLDSDDLLSVQEIKKLKAVFQNVLVLGIFANIVPNLPLFKNIPDDGIANPAEMITSQYGRLVFVLDILILFIKRENYRSLIIPEFMKAILVGLYQIMYCPVKKPSEQPDQTGFHMTEDYYKQLMDHRNVFKVHFDYLSNSVFKPIYVKETMLLVNSLAPLWFKRAVGAQLTQILISNKGVEYISAAMFDGNLDDTTRTWNTLDAITNLILDCKKSTNCLKVCQQVVDLLKTKKTTLYERIFVCVTKRMYLNDAVFCERVFIKPVLDLLARFSTDRFEDNEDITDDIEQIMRVLHSLFVERHGERGVLPVNLLKPFITVLFRLHTMLNSIKSISYDSKDILVKYVKICNSEETFALFDAWLLYINNCADIKNLELTIDGKKITAKYLEQTVVCTPEENGEALMELLKNNSELLLKLFTYLLNCLVEEEKYFKSVSRRDLLEQESDFVVDEGTQRKLVVFKLLASLAEDKGIQEQIAGNPAEIVNYVETVFKRTVHSGLLKKDSSSEGFQSVFTLSMILQLLVENSGSKNLKSFEKLIPHLAAMVEHCNDEELKTLLSNVLEHLNGTRQQKRSKAKVQPTELDVALEEICDPMLPVRGHGLVTLTELVKKKDQNAMERILYIQNIFRQNLKTEDSFMYLRAVEGLAAVSLALPDAGLAALADEFTDFSRKDTDDGVEVRMKVGEVLVRVTKMLGEMCPHYKNILLNTFLTGVRDDDYLIRASSLSNLAEVCEVLGYKLGSIVSEILTCVHAVITTDKCVEPRRAAVTVIRQLLRGLGNEMIFFLKDAILPIYHELKLIYHSDKDDVMRLQAQLALEELNENMKEFIFPKPKLNADVKPIIMN